MPLRRTAAPSSTLPRSFRTTKSRSSNPLSKPAQARPTKTPSTSPTTATTSVYIPPSHLLHPTPTSVLPAIAHIRRTLFSPLPADFRGLPTPLVAPLLQFRAQAPPYVPLPLLQALLGAPTATATEIDGLVRAGTLRRLGEGLLSAEWLYELVSAHPGLEDGVKGKLVGVMKAQPASERTVEAQWTVEEVRALLDAGFLVLVGVERAGAGGFEGVGKSTLVSACSAAASGSVAAAGGSGVSVAGVRAKGAREEVEYKFSVPGLGRFLGVLRKARGEMKGMLPKRGQVVAVKSLKERWDGQGNRLGRLKKWRVYQGLSFEAVVGEMLGRGEAELVGIVGGGFGIRVR